jgi:hypothetical protein
MQQMTRGIEAWIKKEECFADDVPKSIRIWVCRVLRDEVIPQS